MTSYYEHHHKLKTDHHHLQHQSSMSPRASPTSPSSSRRQRPRRSLLLFERTIPIMSLIAANLFVYQLSWQPGRVNNNNGDGNHGGGGGGGSLSSSSWMETTTRTSSSTTGDQLSFLPPPPPPNHRNSKQSKSVVVATASTSGSRGIGGTEPERAALQLSTTIWQREQSQNDPLGIPTELAVALPGLTTNNMDEDGTSSSSSSLNAKLNPYGDPKHLGGFAGSGMASSIPLTAARERFFLRTLSPAVWKLLVRQYGVHSVLDVGCGRGFSTAWFLQHGLRAQCVEGSAEAIRTNVVATSLSSTAATGGNSNNNVAAGGGIAVSPVIVGHDYTRGPWWPAETYDAAWVMDVMDRINVQYFANMFPTLRKAALIFVTTATEPPREAQAKGYLAKHVVEYHRDAWWIRKFELAGFRYDANLTSAVRETASREHHQQDESSPIGVPYNAKAITDSVKVFINPAVAALPGHAHLFPEFGCYGGTAVVHDYNNANLGQQPKSETVLVHRECGTPGEAGHTGGEDETPLDPAYYPLSLTAEQDAAWYKLVQDAWNNKLPQGQPTSATSSRRRTTEVKEEQEQQEERHHHKVVRVRLPPKASEKTKQQRLREEAAAKKREQQYDGNDNNSLLQRLGSFVLDPPQQQQQRRRTAILDPAYQQEREQVQEAMPSTTPRTAMTNSNPTGKSRTNTTTTTTTRGTTTTVRDLHHPDVTAVLGSRFPIPVVVWPMVEYGVRSAESQHAFENGITESKYITLESSMYSVSPDVVWVADTGYGMFKWNDFCDEFAARLIKGIEFRRQFDLSTRFPVYIIDFTDGPTHMRCRNIEKLVGRDQVKYTERAVTRGRHWDETLQWIQPGRLLNSHQRDRKGNVEVKYHHIPLYVRTDTVETLKQVLETDYHHHSYYNNENNKKKGKKKITLASDLSRVIPDRDLDVVHFWPAHDFSKVATVHCNLRVAVSRVVLELGRNRQNDPDHDHPHSGTAAYIDKHHEVGGQGGYGMHRSFKSANASAFNASHHLGEKLDRDNKHWPLKVFVGLAGKPVRQGRRGVAQDYVRKLLRTKIVVVTQRDTWEDHYRLFEAFVGGAMVMTDRMLGLPEGLVNGTSVVEFSSGKQLVDLIYYYLEHDKERLRIAHQGRKVAMSQHRTWHRMEQVIFGQTLSRCNNQDHGSSSGKHTKRRNNDPCPYVVHAKETYQ